MKKSLLISIALISSLFLVSCGTKPLLDSHGCYESADEAITAAKKAKKDILIFATQNPEESSLAFETTVFGSDIFKEFEKAYIICHMEFGDDFIAKTIPGINDSISDELTSRYSQALIANSMISSCLAVSQFPAVYLLTKEGYYIADLNYAGDISDAETLKTKLAAVSEKASTIHSHLEATKKGSVSERMDAINWFMEEIDDDYSFSYVPLFYEGVELDKNNESGLVSSFYVRKVLLDAIRFAKVNDIASAVTTLEAGAKSGKLDGPEKQEVLYQAGVLLMQFGADDFTTIIHYFQAAIAADPESEIVPELEYVIAYLQMMAEYSASEAAAE